MFIIYDILYGFFCCIYFPYLIVRRKWHPGFKIRFGYFPASIRNAVQGGQNIWIHAVSVGEVLAVSGLIQDLLKRFPQCHIVCSTVTQTGNAIAREKLGVHCTVIYAPLDFSWIVRKFIALINPKVYISAETEIWPNLYTVLHAQGVPIVQVNGRISDRAFRGYKRGRPLVKNVLACVSRFCMQSSLDAERICALGANRNRVIVTGNLKFNNPSQRTTLSKEDFGFHPEDKLIVAGSTHPGEEEALMDIVHQLRGTIRGLRLILIPRHIERADEIIQLVERKGYHAVRSSRIRSEHMADKTVVVGDQIGELPVFYGVAQVVFVGKSLKVGGGQNMIEPAALGKPTIVGPMTQNFKDIVKIFLDSGGLVQVQDTRELHDKLRELLNDVEKAETIGNKAKQTVEENQGALRLNSEAIGEFLTPEGNS